MCELHADPQPGTEAARASSISEFVDALVVALTNTRIYSPDHPRVRSLLEALVATLEAQLDAEGGDGRLEIGAADSFLFHRTRPLLAVSLSASRILTPLQRMGSGGIRFHRGATEEDLLALIAILGARRDEFTSRVAAHDALAARGCKAIEFLPRAAGSVAQAGPGGRGRGGPGGEGDDGNGEEGSTLGTALHVAFPVQVYQRAIDLLQDSLVQACHGNQVDVTEGHGLVEAMLKHLREDPKSMMQACRYEQYDAFTFGHSLRVAALTLDFARTLTRDEALLHRIGLSALFHDVGKARIDPDVLLHRGQLSDDQRREMMLHTLYGAEILLESEDSEPLSVATAFGHHRTRDNQGFPATVHRARMSAATRLIKICDVYEALTAVRPYKDSMSPTRAFRIMISMARQQSHFDEALLRLFIAHTGVYPVGASVRLDTGEIARVERQTKDLSNPVVVVEYAENGERLDGEDATRLDLSSQDGKGKRRVTALLAEGDLPEGETKAA